LRRTFRTPRRTLRRTFRAVRRTLRRTFLRALFRAAIFALPPFSWMDRRASSAADLPVLARNAPPFLRTTVPRCVLHVPCGPWPMWTDVRTLARRLQPTAHNIRNLVALVKHFSIEIGTFLGCRRVCCVGSRVVWDTNPGLSWPVHASIARIETAENLRMRVIGRAPGAYWNHGFRSLPRGAARHLAAPIRRGGRGSRPRVEPHHGTRVEWAARKREARAVEVTA
jgi:hypothetical protein